MSLVPTRTPWTARALLALLLCLSGGCRRSAAAVDGALLDDGSATRDGAHCAATDPRSTPVVVGVQPDESEAAYVGLISRAQKSLRVFAYLMGKGGILDGLKQQAGRGVEVRAILDAGQAANQTYFTQLQAAGVKVQWSDPRFPYMHAKVLVGDDREALISTGNYSLSYITKERNFTALTTDVHDVATLRALFDADWGKTNPDLTCTRLLVAPVNSRPRLLELLGSARSTLIIESMQFADSDVRAAVAARQQAGVEVRVILAAPSWIDTNTEAATFLKGAGIPVRWLASPAVHTKDLVVDGKTAYLGSINLSSTSISRNREVGIIFSDAAGVQRLVATFEKDWAAATAF